MNLRATLAAAPHAVVVAFPRKNANPAPPMPPLWQNPHCSLDFFAKQAERKGLRVP
jgi:hypothetical protein